MPTRPTSVAVFAARTKDGPSPVYLRAHTANFPGMLWVRPVDFGGDGLSEFIIGEEDTGASHTNTQVSIIRVTPPPERGPTVQTVFAVVGISALSLCLACHESLAENIRKATTIHAPVAEGRFGVCHDPHGTDFPKLFTKAAWEGEWEPPHGPPGVEVTRLCTNCTPESAMSCFASPLHSVAQGRSFRYALP